MHAQPRMILLLLLYSLVACPGVWAQQENSSPAPATAPAATPAPSANNDPAADSAPAKKVWTNEDFGSKASPAPRGNAKSGKAPVSSSKPQPDRVRWYRQQIAKLAGQTADIDDKITKYQSALRGETQPSTGLQEYHIHRGDWQSEIDKLQKQRQDLDAKIDSLEDAARHEGIEPGLLR